jgi:hypothetical protein
MDALAGIIARHSLEVLNEALLAVPDGGVVLDICLADVLLDRLPRPALVEHQIVEGDRALLVLLQPIGHIDVLPQRELRCSQSGV